MDLSVILGVKLSRVSILLILIRFICQKLYAITTLLWAIRKNTISAPEATAGSSLHPHVAWVFRGSKHFFVFKEIFHFLSLLLTLRFPFLEWTKLWGLFDFQLIFPRQHFSLVFLVSLLNVNWKIALRPDHSFRILFILSFLLMMMFAGPTHAKRKPPLKGSPSVFKVILCRSLFHINVLGCVMISARDGMDFFVFFLNFLVSKVHLIIRLLFVQLLIQSHIFLKNIFQLGLSLIKRSIVVVLDLLFSMLRLLKCRDLALLFRVDWQTFIAQARRCFTMGFWIGIGLLRLFELGKVKNVRSIFENSLQLWIAVHVT